MWAPLIVLGTAFFLLTLRTGIGNEVLVSDGYYYYAYLPSVFLDGDLDFANQFTHHDPGEPPETRTTPTGLVRNKYPVGVAFLNAPFFLAGHAVSRVGTLVGAMSAPLDGYGFPEQFAFWIGNVFWALLGLEYAFRLARRFVPESSAFIAVTVFWLSSNLVYYTFKEPVFAHATSFFTVTAFLLAERAAGPLGTKVAFRLGLLAGLMTMVENQNVLYVSVPLLVRWHELRAQFARPVLGFALGGVAGMLPQMAVWQIVFGAPLTYSYEGEGFNFLAPKLLEILFSFEQHGLIIWTPVVAFALAGLFWASVARHDFRPYLVAFGLQWYLNASWWHISFMGSYSSRKFVSTSAVLVLGLAWLTSNLRTRALRVAAFVVAAALIAWNALLMALYSANVLPATAHLADIPSALHRFWTMLMTLMGLA
jgi:hypothetical protein